MLILFKKKSASKHCINKKIKKKKVKHSAKVQDWYAFAHGWTQWFVHLSCWCRLSLWKRYDIGHMMYNEFVSVHSSCQSRKMLCKRDREIRDKSIRFIKKRGVRRCLEKQQHKKKKGKKRNVLDKYKYIYIFMYGCETTVVVYFSLKDLWQEDENN